MTKAEFLKQQTDDVIEIFETHGSCSPTFAILLEDGTYKSIGTAFNGSSSKDVFDSLMRKLCENPKVIASTFYCEAWVSETAMTENKPPSECEDKETIVYLVYTTRDGIKEFHLYKPNHLGKLELVKVRNEFEGLFCNPFNTAVELTKSEKDQAIDEFQVAIRESLCDAYEEFKALVPMLFFLSNSKENVSVRWVPDEEWKDKDGLKRMIKTKCQEARTIAFLLAFPVESNIVNMLLMTDDYQEKFTYEIDESTSKLKLVSRTPYYGEYSGMFLKSEKLNDMQND